MNKEPLRIQTRELTDTLERIAMRVQYDSSRPAHISPERWSAMQRFLNRPDAFKCGRWD